MERTKKRTGRKEKKKVVCKAEFFSKAEGIPHKTVFNDVSQQKCLGGQPTSCTLLAQRSEGCRLLALQPKLPPKAFRANNAKRVCAKIVPGLTPREAKEKSQDWVTF